MRHLVILRDVCVRFGTRSVLENVSMRVAPGAIVSIVGPNGGGKSTAVRLIAGTFSTHSGTVERAAHLRIGYQPQRSTFPQNMPMTVRAMLRTRRGGRDGTETEDMLHSLCLPPALLDTQMAALSGGERQRIMIARAMLRRPDLLVLDEPGAYSDKESLSRIYARIGEFSKSTGCATVMVSHDMNRVLALSEHVYCLNQKIVCEGGPDSVVADVEFEKNLGGRAATGIYRHMHRS